jgi:hypothetical protein
MDKCAVILSDRTRVQAAQALVDAPDGWHVKIEPATRSTRQNSLLWPLLTDVSRQVNWHGKKLTPEVWKDIFTAAHKKALVVPGLDGGFVVCGQSTRVMDKQSFSDLIEIILAFCAEQGVRVSAPQDYEQFLQREAA